jgi:hypothetical protein
MIPQPTQWLRNSLRHLGIQGLFTGDYLLSRKICADVGILEQQGGNTLDSIAVSSELRLKIWVESGRPHGSFAGYSSFQI